MAKKGSNNQNNKNTKKPGEKTLAVTMIVKNESKVILRCLESLCDWIDYWVIHDTGSTDGTQDMIKNFMNEKNIPGELHQTPWKDFGHNRSLAIASTQFKADYTLLCDADFILKVIDPDFKKKLNADGYLVKYEGHLDYRQNLLVNCKYLWKYIGVTHEYIHCPEAPNIIATDLIKFKHFADGGSRADKFTRDISLLLKGIEAEPQNSRYYFYLAQSLKDTEQWDEAISYYRKRVDFGGWGEEVYYSLYQLGMCKKRRGDPFWSFMGDLLRAYW
jgi:glycosyltransferase involved in cell wall biosynthesis